MSDCSNYFTKHFGAHTTTTADSDSHVSDPLQNIVKENISSWFESYYWVSNTNTIIVGANGSDSIVGSESRGSIQFIVSWQHSYYWGRRRKQFNPMSGTGSMLSTDMTGTSVKSFVWNKKSLATAKTVRNVCRKGISIRLHSGILSYKTDKNIKVWTTNVATLPKQSHRTIETCATNRRVLRNWLILYVIILRKHKHMQAGP